MRYYVGIHNGYDIDDYYPDADSKEEAIGMALYEANATIDDVYAVEEK